MANAIPVNTEAKAEEKADKPRRDARRPVLAPEVEAQGKPKNVTKLPDGTIIEDY